MDSNGDSERPVRRTPSAGWLDRLRGRPVASARPRREPPAHVAVVTDSAAAVPPEWAAAHADRLRVVPMPVMIDGQIYTEGLDDVETELALALAMGKTVQTSRPAPGLFARSYRELAEAGATHIVSIHISGRLSGTVDAARLAGADGPVPVTVIDTQTVALAQGFAVMDAVAAAEAGAGPEEVAGAAAHAADHLICFAVPSLEQLRRGGRITTAASMIGTLLAVKPILGIADGQVVVKDKVRTLPKALARLVDLARSAAADRHDGARMAVQYFGNRSQALELVHELAGSAHGDVWCVSLPAVLAAHTGAGVLAVAVDAPSRPRTPEHTGPSPAVPGDETTGSGPSEPSDTDRS
ncbi:DegV family protein [Zafaria sp. Z1313]|uniref:DegV family protein n=1 Tax=Zafaria sp. Z1313 TaxID=3423202 RepID=UPI003D3019C2